MPNKDTITVRVQDMSGQREFVAKGVRTDVSWGEAMNGILAGMSLPTNTPTSETVLTGRLEREGRHLHDSEIVGDALCDQDLVRLEQEVSAG